MKPYHQITIIPNSREEETYLEMFLELNYFYYTVDFDGERNIYTFCTEDNLFLMEKLMSWCNARFYQGISSKFDFSIELVHI